MKKDTSIRDTRHSGADGMPLADESHEKLKVVLESVYNAIIAVDSEGIITTWNPSAERITGIPAEKAIGKYIMDIIPNTGLLETLRTGECSYSRKIQFGDIMAVTNRSLIIKNGKITGAVAVLQDISDLEAVASELKASQELNKELDAIIDSVYEGLYITDGKGYTTRINKSYTRITGIRPEEVIGWHMQDLVEKGYYSQSVTLIVLEKKQPVTIMHTIKGSKRCLITGNPVFDGKGEVIRVVTTVRDITELINLKAKLEQSEERTRRYHLELEHLRQQQMVTSDLIGESKEIKMVEELAGRASQVDATVLLLGETGVGKDIIARKIHKDSPRHAGPFIKVNCAAIPENLLESELFGYEKGAFTGAFNRGKPGMFELADSGTIFLDEVGDLPLNLQAKLLRVLQEKEITRIGGMKPQKLDLRIIAATNRDLQTMVKKDLFREDLYYRLNVVPIHIPPLRVRREDIPLLVTHYLDFYNNKYNRKKQFSGSALEILKHYSWPGNVRELSNLLERLVITSNENIIDPEYLKGLVDGNNTEVLAYNCKREVSLEEAVASVEKELVARALSTHKSTRKAARALGVSQPTVVRKARKYGINHLE